MTIWVSSVSEKCVELCNDVCIFSAYVILTEREGELENNSYTDGVGCVPRFGLVYL